MMKQVELFWLVNPFDYLLYLQMLMILPTLFKRFVSVVIDMEENYL
jgi:hypothetical protein